MKISGRKNPGVKGQMTPSWLETSMEITMTAGSVTMMMGLSALDTILKSMEVQT